MQTAGIMIGVIVLAAVFCLIRSIWEIRQLCVTRVKVPANQIKENIRFAVLADLHGASFGNENETLKRRIKEEAPDAILIPGDMVIGKRGRDTSVAEALLFWLAENYPVFYIPGNHEMRARDDTKKYGEQIRDYWNRVKEIPGVSCLENASVRYKDLTIAGLDLAAEYYEKGNRKRMDLDYMERSLGKKPESYTVLLAHNPEYFEEYAAWGANLVLSGHNHGGIVRLPFLGGLLSAGLKLFDPFNGGIHQKDGTTMVVSRGLGTHTIPVRFLNIPEIVVVNLEKNV